MSIKLSPTTEQELALRTLQIAFAEACNRIVPAVVEHRCWNRVVLHHLTYYAVRGQSVLGSQMVCNAIQSVCDAYRALSLKRADPVPVIAFHHTSSLHFDKRTYSLRPSTVSLYTLTGRIHVRMMLGPFQSAYLTNGVPKEAQVVCRRGHWYLNLVLDLPDAPSIDHSGPMLGVDLGENVLAATSTGKLFGGGQLRHARDCFLSTRRRLQSNGSQSARQRLSALSGREQRHVRQVNHEVSKAIIHEALTINASVIAMETLTHIRRRIRAKKRERTRLHRWAWAELQTFIEYKAQAVGIRVLYVNPAYTSQTCASCGQRGHRLKHRFSCSVCGILTHSDLNASRNLVRIARSADLATGAVDRPHVAGRSA